MSAALSRRALFGSAGKVAAAAALVSLPVVATAALAPQPDAAIIAGLHRWCAAVRAYVASPLDSEDPRWEALLQVADDEIHALALIPAHTIDGLAIKAYLAMRYEYGGARGNELLIDREGGLMADQSLAESMAADVLHLSPILAAAIAGGAQ